MKKSNPIFAYEKININYDDKYREIENLFDDLLELSNNISSPLMDSLKPTIAISIKWKFDYLAKTSQSPFNLIKDIQYWINTLEMFSQLKDKSWFEGNDKAKKIDVWERTRDAFNFMWPKNTSGSNYDISKEMVSLRLKQIIDLIEGGKNFIKNSIIIDSGCGPGRYTDVLSEYNPKKIIGIDAGEDIINKNRKKFSKNKKIEMIQSSCESLPLENNFADIVISAGVLHHLPNPMENLIAEHARVIKKNGYLFIFIAGKGGLELKVWEFLRKLLKSISVETLFKCFDGIINPLRLQGLLDHGYGEYQQTDRKELEELLEDHFGEIIRVPGIEGLDVTEEIYSNDKYFKYRFGTGNLRYLCKK